ncbi:MAG: tryptophan synthase alpha chain, partial [Halieaceae bacterium]
RVGLRQVLAMVAEFRLRDDKTPVLLMGYCNPIEAMGYETFTKAAAVAGIDAVLTVDMPPEEVGEFGNMLAAVNIDNVLLVSLTTSHERMKHIVASARGFIYFVSLKGVTGAGNLDVSAVAKACAQLRDLSDLPIGVGFGIKDVNSAMAIGVEADAVVVGSALVDRMANIDLSLPLGSMLAEAASLIGDIRAGLDGVEQAE